MPGSHRELTRDHSGRPVIAKFGKFHYLMGFIQREGLHAPVIEDQERDVRQALFIKRIGAGSAGILEGEEEVADTKIADSEAQLAGTPTQCAGEICFADTGGTRKDHALLLLDERAVTEAASFPSNMRRTTFCLSLTMPHGIDPKG